MNETFLLALNTAEGRLQLALGRDAPEGARLAWSEALPAASQGVELLVPALERGLAACGASAASIRRIACVAGPGGFTGLRLACATAAGLAAAGGALQAGMPLLPLLAENAARAGLEAGVFAVLTHARRDLVYAQAFAGGTLRPLTDLLVLEPGAAARLMPAKDASAVFLGSGTSRNRAVVAAGGARVLGPEYDVPAPETLLRAADRLAFGPDPVAPLYVRASDAEENLPALAAALGLDPAEAGAALRAFTSARPEEPR